MSHTPGPWFVSADRIASDHGDIAAVHYQSFREQKGWRCADDARLIAAAPELLAVCQAIASDLSLFQFTDGEYRLSEQSAGVILQSLREVIDKAHGRSE